MSSTAITAKQHIDQISAVRDQLAQVQQATENFAPGQKPKVNLQNVVDDLRRYETWAEGNADNIQQALKTQTRSSGA